MAIIKQTLWRISPLDCRAPEEFSKLYALCFETPQQAQDYLFEKILEFKNDLQFSVYNTVELPGSTTDYSWFGKAINIEKNTNVNNGGILLFITIELYYKLRPKRKTQYKIINGETWYKEEITLPGDPVKTKTVTKNEETITVQVYVKKEELEIYRKDS